MKKRVFAAAVIISLFILIISGCSGNTAAGPVAAPVPTSTPVPGWKIMGTAQFTAGSATYGKIFVSGGIPFVAYCDAGYSKHVAVQTFSGSSWGLLGTTGDGLSQGDASDVDMYVYNGVPYVIYQDLSAAFDATCMKYESNSWQSVDAAGFTTGDASKFSIKFNGSVPYFSFRDGNSSNKISVMKLNGSAWEYVGPAGFSAGAANYTDLAVDSGNLYVAYQEWGSSGSDGFAACMSYTASSGTWDAVGNTNFSNSLQAEYLKIEIISGAPYVGYRDQTGKIFVKVYNSGTGAWETAGGGAVSTAGSMPDMYYDGTALYVAYRDNNLASATVKKLNGGLWEAVGSEGFTSNEPYSISLYVNSGRLYLAYQDGANNGLSVMSYY